MGYTTTFEGRMRLSPTLTVAQKHDLNSFCEDRHGGNTQVDPGFPGFWCDWMTDGEYLQWNGNEKSYDMAAWLEELISRYFRPWGVTVSGKILAQGEDLSDRWTMEVGADQKVKVQRVSMKQSLGITD
jgi:hypothetical protein